jgi:16S rRNA (cytidine1402-2'-O)-methyltransferase
VAAGHRVESLPGASAVLAALAVSGLPVAPFTFIGFLPRRTGERAAVLAEYAERSETLVVFESPKRLARTLLELAGALGDRPACVARELTKLHEEVRRGPLRELADHYESGTRGEVTVVVHGAPAGRSRPAAADAGVLDERIRKGLEAGGRPKEIAAVLAEETGLARRVLYAQVIRVRDEPGAGDADG